LRALLLLFVATAASAQISPRVRLVAERHLPAMSLSDGRDDRIVITARLLGGAERLRKLGFEATEYGGDVAGLRLNEADLQKLLSLNELVQVDERRQFRTLLEQAGPLVNAPAARMESGLDGKNVLVGVVDTGADVRHADLRTANGTTKVAALLDVLVPEDARHLDLGSYGGAIWLQDELQQVLDAEAAGLTAPIPFSSKDTSGHGTHVAGIAVSTGLATGNDFPAGRYVGVAPGADLIVVQASHGGGEFFEGQLLEACRFVIDRARALNRPVVLNLSLGGRGGAHDGTTNVELALSALFPEHEPGRVLVVAAGNEGLTDHHAGGWALDGEVTIPLHVDKSDVMMGQVGIDLWGATENVAISLLSPSGKRLGPIATGRIDHLDTSEGTLAIDHSPRPRLDGKQQSGLVIMGEKLEGDWQIVLSGRAPRWDLWITETPDNRPLARFTDHLVEDNRLAIPGSTRTAISVGSFVSRRSWITIDGMTFEREITVGVPSLFSSAGPSADGRFTPDLAAPGEFIISALSRDAHPDQPTSDFYVGGSTPNLTWADDGVHGVLRGTSQASPMVAGAVALLLQIDPSLTAHQIRELLRATARDTGPGWSPRSGFGTLDVAAAIAATTGHYGTTLDPEVSSVGVSLDQLPPGDSLTTVTVTPRDVRGMPLGPGHTVEITVSAGELVGPVVDMKHGRYEQRVRARASRGQVGVVTAVVDGTPLSAHPRIHFVPGRDEIGQPFSARGGCSPFGPPSGAGLLLLFGATLFLRRKSKYCSPKAPRL
jgi:subtilisin family serine protease